MSDETRQLLDKVEELREQQREMLSHATEEYERCEIRETFRRAIDAVGREIMQQAKQ